MSLEYFIASRTASRGRSAEPSVIMRVATIAVAVSIIMMTISLAVIYGFKREITTQLSGFSSHVVVGDVRGVNVAQSSPIQRNEVIESILEHQPGVHDFAPYAVSSAIARSEDTIEGVLLKGVDSLYDWGFFEDALTEGVLPTVDGAAATREALISNSLADRLQLEVGDKLELMLMGSGTNLKRDLYKISGLYASQSEQADMLYILTDLRQVQRANRWTESQISGYELMVEDVKYATDIADSLNEQLLYLDDDSSDFGIAAYSIEQISPAMFAWLDAHDVNAAVIIIIMLIVAGFNMATALLILVLERRRMVGVLKVLGMNNRSLGRIFLLRSLKIIGYGMACGNGIALILCSLQHHFKLLKLDSEGYGLSSVPISLDLWWWLPLNVGVVVVIVAIMTIPVRLVAKIDPEQAIR